ncbi:MAG: methylglyoxal synthase [Lachnospiraceae bacterium]|nr:methylglyoxal synthase [Lachnospiraceae bacterium]
MNIGFIAHNSRKNLIENFCLAYKYILGKHELYATENTGRRIEEATNLKVHKFLSGSVGGEKQFIDMIERDYMDLVIFFYNPLLNSPNEADIFAITRSCDRYNIPIATNIGTAESMVLGLANGDLDWRGGLKHEF